MQDTEQLKYLIALPLLPEVGLHTSRKLLEYFGSAEAVFLAKETDWLTVPNIRRETVKTVLSGRAAAIKRAEQEAAFIEKHGISTFALTDEDYPYRLRECPDAPLLLYGKGRFRLNEGRFLAVVGTRMPSERGKDICRQIVTDLAERVPDLTIVSGLAYGIDVTAHKAAISSDIPTLIIPGHGVDRIYPAVHRKVAVEALTKGGILTEYMTGTEPDRQNFVARNRIIAGLCDATLVVESRKKGGSLITADMANGYSRDVFAVPGRPDDEASRGCNNLIKQQKAALVENADDIIGFMQWESRSKPPAVQTELFEELTAEEEALLDMLRGEPDGMHVNLLVMQTARPYSEISSTLLMMEMRGLVRPLPGGLYKALK